jgi:hypothetical protein
MIEMRYTAIGKPFVSVDLLEYRFSAQKAAIYACLNNDVVKRFLQGGKRNYGCNEIRY